MLLWEVIGNAASAEPDALALVADGRRWSFAELWRDVCTQAAELAGLLETGDRVVVIAENSAAFVAGLYCVPLAGGVLAMANTRHTTAEVAGTVDRCGATVVMGDPGQLRRLEGHLPSCVRHVLPLALPEGGPAGELDASAGRPPAPPIVEGDPAWLIHTSGTTGPAKGAVLTHRSILAAVLNTTMARPVAPDEVYLFPFPLFHVAAYNVVHHHLRHRPVVLLPRFEEVAVMEAIEAEAVTSVSLAPTMLAMLLDHQDRYRHDLTTLRTVSYGAAAMPRDLLHRVLAEWPRVGLAQGYGMTELSGNAVFLSPQDHRAAVAEDPGLLTAAGRPGPLARLLIVDEDGVEVAPGGTGEILVHGDQVCAGYWQDPEATKAAVDGGWLHTGDMGRIDERGYLHVVDRKKDIIITGGENVSSREVEDALGAVAGVAAAAVVGVPDDHWGERVVAVIVAEEPNDPPSLECLRGGCESLAGFKHPRAVVRVDALPTNASGKVDKVALRALATEHLAR